MRSERAEILRFGVFEVDVRAGELRKQGARIKLQEQPFHVLTVLLQRSGEWSHAKNFAPRTGLPIPSLTSTTV